MANLPTPWMGELRLFAGLFPPQGWVFCKGQLLEIDGNEVLFSLLGTQYGGDGVKNFALPNLQSRLPLHYNDSHPIGQSGGEEMVTLNQNELPAHSHTVYSNEEGGADNPAGNFWGYSNLNPYSPKADTLTMNAECVSTYGQGEPHENRIPFVAIYYIMSLSGEYPGK